MFFDLRLADFLPALLIPPAAVPSVAAGFLLLYVSIYTLPSHTRWAAYFRLAAAPPAVLLLWDFGYGAYATPANQVAVGMAVVGLYGIMRVLETSLIGLRDVRPPYWVQSSTGEELPLPETLGRRVLYALDLTTSLRGTSWLADTHWDWAPRSLLESPARSLSRAKFLRGAVSSLLRQYLFVDLLDTLNKSHPWPAHSLHPISTLPLPKQLVFSFSICAGTLLSITLPYTLLSLSFVLLGAPPAGWPPMFAAPFSAFSLADFWGRRWHLIFRRVFSRLALVLPAPRVLRPAVMFALSAALHELIMARLAPPGQRVGALLDTRILSFFLAQPLGLAIEAGLVAPLARATLPEQHRVIVTRLWAWAFLLWAGRFWADVWVFRGLWDETERVVGYSAVRGLLWGKWAV